MPGTIVVGAQWGDEGKGKITDLITADFDYVVRTQGGNNAGHTVIHGDTHLALHLVPSGILYPEVTPVIGNGVVVDLRVLLQEMADLAAAGVSCERLMISANAHLIMPWHLALDAARERQLGDQSIGTTQRGIGPAYESKIARSGLRVQDLLDPQVFAQKVSTVLQQTNALLRSYDLAEFDSQAIAEEYAGYARQIQPHVQDTALVLNKALRNGQRVLFEGAQGTLLDIDHGTYPFVTSSNCTAGGALTGSGVGPLWIERVLGISKAYCTRVGNGLFPTELADENGRYLAEAGHEVGTTTGRPRRCGWFDAVIARYAVAVNGLSDLCLTKLDVLGGLPQLEICTAYQLGGQRWEILPPDQNVLRDAQPVYEQWPGWQADIANCQSFAELPTAAQHYVQRLEELCGVPINLIGVGPERSQTIRRD